MSGEIPKAGNTYGSAWSARLTKARTWVQTPRFRPWFRGFGLTLLLGGAAWSISELDIQLSDLSLGYLALNLLVLSPLLLVVAGATLRIAAWALGRDVPLSKAIQAAAAANVAELLPLPGGALVRGAVLMRAGAKMGESASMITLTAFLTLAMTITLSAVALALMGQFVGWWLAGAGFLGTVATLAWLARRVPLQILTAMVVIRLVTLTISVLRLAVSFAALGEGTSFAAAALYTIASSLGTAISIVPAGFGVNEAIAAGLATLIAASPAAAFLAVALNRALDLTVGAVLNLLLNLFRTR